MTFEELKFEILDKQRRIEINKLFHLYVKAESYSDILRVVKSEGNFRWILQNGFRDFLQYFPTEELENEGFYDREIELSDSNTDIIILSQGTLNLTQSGNSRCRVVSDGGRLNISLQNNSMIEIESYGRSVVNITANSYSYSYINARESSNVTLNGNDQSTFMIFGFGKSITTLNMASNSWTNYQMNDDAKVNFSG